MLQKIGRYLGILVLLIVAVLTVAWATSPDPRFNPASFEEEPLTAGIAPLNEAVTLAQYRNPDGKIITLQVLSFSGETITGIDLASLGAAPGDDPFAALESANAAPVTLETASDYPSQEVAMSDLLPSGTSGMQHIGTGTNFPEHAEEANSASVFQFPKFGAATPARTKISASQDFLLDYEVELCIRFDRDISSAEDFEGAKKGLFLCGDFTNRNLLVQLADPNNLNSGRGLSDAKSGPQSFPTGPFLVIPNDWAAFTKNLRMTTTVNGEPRQDARGAEMILDFKQLSEKALGDMSEPRFLYRDTFHFLTTDKRINTSTTLMSGTSEGVIFAPPTRADIIEALVRYIRAGGPLSDTSFTDIVGETFVENEIESDHFLKAGDIIRHDSNFLGDIEVEVTPL